MTTIEQVAVTHHDRPFPDDAHADAPVEISQPELVELIQGMRVQAREKGNRVPGRPTLAKTIGVTPYRVRQALEEIARVERSAPQRVERHQRGGHTVPKGVGTAGPTQDGVRPARGGSRAVSEPPTRPAQPAVDVLLRTRAVTNGQGLHGAPTGASAAQPVQGRAKVHRDITGGIVRAAVLISMFVLAAAVWIKAAELSGHQVDLGTLPVVGWPVRLAYFAPILVEGAVYAAIRICHTLNYVRDATRGYARRTAVIGLFAMVVVGATVGLGFADEPYARDAIGGLIGGLGPYMGWRTSKAAAMVAGDRHAATENGSPATEAIPARPQRLAGLLDTLSTAATTRVTSWANKARSGAGASTTEAGARSK